MSARYILCLIFVVVRGVFVVDPDKLKSVSVTEGENVTLHVDLTNLQKEDQLQWMFNKNNTDTCLAYIHKRYNSTSIYDNVDNGRFRGRLKLDSQTGSLSITHMRISDSGLFTPLIISNIRTLYNTTFNVTVYALLPVPVISRKSSQCSSSSERSSVCVLLCSVLNVSHVSLSWYKGSSLLSSISVSDLNIRLSLPLEVDYEDTNTYTCVLNNPITNHTQHLHISQLCQCSGLHHNVFIIIAVAIVFLLIAAAGLGCLVKYRIVAVKHCQINRQEAHELCEDEVLSMNHVNNDKRLNSDEVV